VSPTPTASRIFAKACAACRTHSSDIERAFTKPHNLRDLHNLHDLHNHEPPRRQLCTLRRLCRLCRLAVQVAGLEGPDDFIALLLPAPPLLEWFCADGDVVPDISADQDADRCPLPAG